VPTTLSISVVIVTLAIVVLVAAAILAIIRLGQAVAQTATAVQRSLAQLERTLHETNELLATVRVMTPAVQSVVGRFQRLGERAADISTAVLDEVEQPVFTAAAVARGVRTGTAHLIERLTRRIERRTPSHNGDLNHE
jgi:uncharacterized protein YoxC